jgi:hypothetical protein
MPVKAGIDAMSRNHAVEAGKSTDRSGIRMTRNALAVAVLLVLPGGGALSAASELDVDGLKPVADTQLADMRGGFSLGGVEISFGVVMETLINGMTRLTTSFNLDNPANTSVALNGNPAQFGDSVNGFTLRQAANGGFVLTNTDGSLATLQQMGNVGGGIVASIQNSLNNQVVQQHVTMNVGIQNMSTVMGLATIGTILDRVGTSLLR